MANENGKKMSNITCAECESNLITFDSKGGQEITLQIYCPKCKGWTSEFDTLDSHSIVFDGIIKTIEDLKTKHIKHHAQISDTRE